MKVIKLKAEKVTQIDLVVSSEDREKVLNWIYESGGATRRSGPLVKNLRADSSKFHVIGHVPRLWSHEDIMNQLAAL